ncbi:MAG: hypothetical protein AAFO98_01825 [Pseudomonadota bacterium]
MEFLQEKDYEPLLDFETRELISKEGKTYKFTMYKLHWKSVDAMADTPFGADYMIKLAEIYAEESSKHTIEMMFPDIVWGIHDWFHNKIGYPTGAPVPPRPCPFVSQQIHKS